MGFKVAFCAGHYKYTAGKRVPKQLDPEETREWVINDRVADHFARAALEYEGVEILRTDDPTGENFLDIPERTAAANIWEADIYIDMHHNAGINGGSGGGVCAFSYPGSEKGREYRDAIYDAVIAAGGLKGNRAQPLQEVRFDSLQYSYMPAVLIEYGFMDSTTDAPVILTDEYSKLVAYATMEGIAQVAGLVKKKSEQTVRGDYTMEMRNLANGNTGEDVRALQILLIGRGYNCGNSGADGIFGGDTDTAVRQYQQDNGLDVDGIAGKNTMGKLLGI